MNFSFFKTRKQSGLPLSLRQAIVRNFAKLLRKNNNLLPDAAGKMVKITQGFFRVFEVLLLDFHNATTGQMNPKQTLIAQEAKLSRRTVIKAIKTLQAVGILSVRKNYIKCVLFPIRRANSYGIIKHSCEAIRRILQFNLLESIHSMLKKVDISRPQLGVRRWEKWGDKWKTEGTSAIDIALHKFGIPVKKEVQS